MTLSNLKIVELASVLAGPSVGRFFSELGAEVIKVENPKTKGDVTRSWKLQSEDKNSSISAYYCSVNMGKKVIFLDLTQEKDYQHLMEILKDADILIVNFKSGDDRKLRLDYNTIHAIFPKLIYGEIIGFNHSDRVAYDLVLQAETGYMSINGDENSGFLKMPVALIDILAGHQLKEGILLALIKRMKTHQGSKITVSLYDAAISSLVNQASNYLMTGEVPQLSGSLHPNIAPYGEIFYSKDNQPFTLAIGSDKQFNVFVSTFQLKMESKYETNQGRVTYRHDLKPVIQDVLGQYSYNEIESLLLKKQIPFGKIRNLEDVLTSTEGKKLIVSEKNDGKIMKSVKSNIFDIQ